LPIDIETAPMLSFHWGAKTEYIPHDFNVQPTTILCAAWRFPGKKIETVSVKDFNNKLTFKSVRKDKGVTQKLHEVLTWCAQNDVIVIYQNGDRFDLPKIMSRVLYHRLPPLPPLDTVDTLKQSRKLGLDYNRLDYKDKFLHGHSAGKVKNRGWPMWGEIVHPESTTAERESAMREMLTYNIGDIPPLERDFETVFPYMTGLQNANMYQGTTHCCPKCGSENVTAQGWKRNKTALYRQYKCKECQSWSRARKSESHKPELTA